jgi:hypothetical protein
MAEMRNAYKSLIKKSLKGRGNSEDLNTDGRIILE